MTDREKVIKGLEICYCPPAKCDDCPYHNLPDEQSCNDMLCLDALALLKEPETIEPETAHYIDCSKWWYECKACGAEIRIADKYCHECGRKIKWE